MVMIILLSGYKSQQDIPLLSENCDYGGYFEYLGNMVKKGIKCIKSSDCQSTSLIKTSLR